MEKAPHLVLQINDPSLGHGEIQTRNRMRPMGDGHECCATRAAPRKEGSSKVTAHTRSVGQSFLHLCVAGNQFSIIPILGCKSCFSVGHLTPGPCQVATCKVWLPQASSRYGCPSASTPDAIELSGPPPKIMTAQIKKKEKGRASRPETESVFIGQAYGMLGFCIRG